jgi:hypothetical protein
VSDPRFHYYRCKCSNAPLPGDVPRVCGRVYALPYGTYDYRGWCAECIAADPNSQENLGREFQRQLEAE